MIERAIEQKVNAEKPRRAARPAPHTAWTQLIPDNEWGIYEPAIKAFRPLNRPFMLAGAFSLATYTGQWRNTKDLDFYILPQDRESFIEVLTRAGFTDYYDKVPYVRHWIYRAWKDDCIVDVIWAHANQRAQVDDQWVEHAREINVRGEILSVVPAEELLWCKLYVLQKDRCDWGDVINLIHATQGNIDWEHLMERLGDDLPLLVGVLNVYCWIARGDRLQLPPRLREAMPHYVPHALGEEVDRRRVDLLDTRPWFAGPENNSEGG